METNLITSTCRKKVGMFQNMVEVTLRPNDDENIAKVLSTTAKACVENIEITNGEANYNLSVLFELTYCDENNNICLATEKTLVNGKIESNILSNNMNAIYKVEVLDTSIENATNTDVKIQATTELMLDVIEYNNLEYFNSDDEKLRLKKELNKVCYKVASGKGQFNINNEFDIKNNISKIICKNVSVCVKNVTSGTEYITIEGDMNIRAYLCFEDGEEKMLKPFAETIAFKEETDAENVSKDNIIEANFCTDYENMTFEIENRENTVVLKVDVPVKVSYIALNIQDVELPCDAYSTTHKVNLITDSYLTNEQMKNIVKQHIEGELEIDENLPRIAKILMLADYNTNITKTSCQNGAVNIEGILTVPVVYLGDDETTTYNGVQVEIPFALTVDLEGINETDDIFIKSNVLDINAKAKKGKDIEIDADVMFDIETFSKQPHAFIKDVVLTEELNPNPYPLSIYLAPAGSTLWDIAKQLAVDENTIVSQNPDLVFPLEKNQSIVYFKKN